MVVHILATNTSDRLSYLVRSYPLPGSAKTTYTVKSSQHFFLVFVDNMLPLPSCAENPR